MTRNGNGYVQMFEGPDGEPVVLLRFADFVNLCKLASEAKSPSGGQRMSKLQSQFVRCFLDKADDNSLYALWSDFKTDSNIRNELKLFISHACAADSPAEPLSDHDDQAAYHTVKSRLASATEEIIPAKIADRLIDGENPVAVWRGYRGLTQKSVAERAGLSQAMISQIETGKRTGDVDTLKRIAEALGVLVDDLVA